MLVALRESSQGDFQLDCAGRSTIAAMSVAEPSLGRAEARLLDDSDPLAPFRDRFVIPDPGLVYLDGNSLGRLPRVTGERLTGMVANEWGGRLIRGWYEEWLELPVRAGDLVGGLVGAARGQVVVADSTTVCLFKLASAALDHDPGRTEVVVQRDEFPTDRYVLESLAASRGLELRWLESDPVAGPSAEDVGAVLGDRTALVVLSHVNYRSSSIAPLEEITRLVHDAGGIVLWDLCHSAGVLPVGLDAAGVDLAVGCTYKYLNGGPGAPAFLYVAKRLQPHLRQPIWGWFGRRDQFLMEQGYEPAPGISAWLSGTPGVLGLAAVEEGARLTAEAGIPEIRRKARAITEYAIALHDERLEPLGFALGSPRDPDRRGSHVSVRRADASELCRSLADAGVLTDFRMPDTIRLGCSPLTTSYTELWDGVDRLVALASAG
jgi:kynureninase